MEVAIPIVGLGAMYLISNQNKEEERDGFTGTQNTSRRLPNTRLPLHNYPVENTYIFCMVFGFYQPQNTLLICMFQ